MTRRMTHQIIVEHNDLHGYKSIATVVRQGDIGTCEPTRLRPAQNRGPLFTINCTYHGPSVLYPDTRVSQRPLFDRLKSGRRRKACFRSKNNGKIFPKNSLSSS